MDEKKDLHSRLVIGNKRDGRREYDEIARDELVRLCLQPGVSIARTAIAYDINANMLRTWITRYQEKQKQALQEQEQAARGAITVEDAQIDIPSPPMRNLPIESPPSPFVPVVSALPMVPSVSPAPQPFKPSLAVGLHVRLPNGVEFDFGEANLEELTMIVQMLGEDAVFRFDENLKVYLHRDPVDFRYGMNSLSILVEQAMRLNPMDSSLYVFTNRRCDRIKILGWQDNGFWLLLKRLEGNDHFVWPDSKSEVVTLTVELLHWLIGGADIAALQRHPKRHFVRVS